MSKMCGECINFDRLLSKCNKMQDDSIRATDTVLCCPFYELRPPTVFDRITTSPEVLAEKLVYYLRYGNCYASSIISDVFKSREEAIAATVAKLKEVEK